MPFASYALSIDWDNDGAFTGANEDISADMIEVEWQLGRDFASQLTGRSTGGTLSALLKNPAGKYNSFKSTSPLVDNLVPGRKTRLQMTVGANTTTVWQGHLDTIEPLPSITRVQRAVLRAVGPLAFINQRIVNVPMQLNILTGTAIGLVLDEFNWPAGDRDIDAGQTTMVRWWTGGQVTALFAMREIEETELGFLRETKDGKIAYEDRHHRLKAPHTASQATWSDDPADALRYREVRQRDPIKEIFNIIEATVQLFTTGSAGTILWTLAETAADSPSIPAGETRDFWASFPNPDSLPEAVAVDLWITPVVTTDYTANSLADGTGTNLSADLAFTVSKFDTAMKMSIKNNASVAAFLTFLQARGTPVFAEDPITIKAEDAASKTKYGERTFPIPGPFLPDTAEARDNTNFVLSIHKDPIPVLALLLSANRSTAHLDEVRLRDVSDRITVKSDLTSELGINEDFFVESEKHRVTVDREHIVEIEISPVGARSGMWVLGVSLLGVDTKLAY